MGSVQEGGWTVSARSGSQSQTQIEQSRKGRNRRRHEEAVGCDSQSGETRNEDGTIKEEDVTRTESRAGRKSSESASDQGSEEDCHSVVSTLGAPVEQRFAIVVDCR